ncbi:hypothetical protein [Flavobacterium filum]|uniref:hypothetical protein n=1 Tax=Flavobacterium TaxID=237 RepID=UPI00047E2F52|nr:hypothetical protein [Flavobacterium filum]
MKRILPLFSYVFHPIFISVYGGLAYFLFLNEYFSYKEVLLYLIQITLLTVLIPLSIFYLLVTLGKIDNLMAKRKEERKIPFLVHLILLYVLTQKSISIENLPELYFFFNGAIFSTIIAFISLYSKHKISIHMIGISSLTVFVMGISIHYEIALINTIALLLICNGFVASSRLYMKAHTTSEIILGSIAGVLPQILLWYFWL